MTEIINEKQDSITLKPLAKGGYNWEIKLYFNDSDPAQDGDKCIERIKALDEKMKQSFPGGKE